MTPRVSRSISRLQGRESLSANPIQGLDRSSLEDRIASPMPLCPKAPSCASLDTARKTDLLSQKSISAGDQWLFVDPSLLDCSSVASDFETIYSNFVNFALITEARGAHNFAPVSLLLGLSVISYYAAVSQHSVFYEKAAKVNDWYGMGSSFLLWARNVLRLVSATLIQIPMGIVQVVAKAIGSKAASLSTYLSTLKNVVAFTAILVGLLQIVSSGIKMVEKIQFGHNLEKGMAGRDKRERVASGLSFLLNQVDLTDEERDRIKMAVEEESSLLGEDEKIELVEIEEGDEKFLTMVDKNYIEEAVCTRGEKKKTMGQCLKRAFILERKRKIDSFERVAGSDALKLIFEELSKPSEKRLSTRLLNEENNLSLSEKAHSLIDQVRKSVRFNLSLDLLMILTCVIGTVAVCLSFVGSGGTLGIVILAMFTVSSILAIGLDSYTLFQDYKEKKVGTRDVVMFVAFLPSYNRFWGFRDCAGRNHRSSDHFICSCFVRGTLCFLPLLWILSR